MAEIEWVSQREITKIIDGVIEEILIPRFKELNMNASGRWLRSIEGVARPLGAEILGMDYTESLVKGRKPGSFPPVDEIAEWAFYKFRVDRKEAMSAAWAIAKKIYDVGTDWYLKGGSNLLEILKEEKTTNYINSRIADFMKARVQLEIVREAKKILQ